MPNVMSDTCFYTPKNSTSITIDEPKCDICSDSLRVNGIRCSCVIVDLYDRLVPTWIKEAPKYTDKRPHGPFNCIIGSEDKVGCWLDNAYQFLMETCPNAFENRFPRIISDSRLLECKFMTGDFEELTFIEAPFIIVEQTALREHGSMADTVYRYVRHRVNKGNYTWLARSTPVSAGAYDYSPDFARLVSSRFTTIDLR